MSCSRNLAWPHTMLLTAMLLAGAATAGPVCPHEYRAGQSDHWAAGRVFYQIFVRSFADADGDGIGDFRGLTARLDYLNDGDPDTDTDLGIEGIWLMPIVESPSYHGYDAVDYDAVERDYGTEADFAAFLAAAHERGIRVIVDLMVNHVSWQHPWFRSAVASRESPYYDWFLWRDQDPGWTQPWSVAQTWHKPTGVPRYYYGLFYAGMPDLDFQNPEVRAEITAVAKRWLARGVDGFRLDAARHIIEAGEEEKADGSPETHAWWREFGAALREDHPDVLLLGEVWTDADEVADYFGDGPRVELDMNFDFELSEALVTAARNGDPTPVHAAMCELAKHLPPHALDATFLTNHDMVRVLTQLRHDRERARLAAGLLLTLPGVPFVYYGEEIGMRNGPGDEDPEKRTPMQWTADGGFTSGEPWYVNRKADPAVHVAGQRADPDSLWHHYRRLIGLRRSEPALGHGGYRALPVAGEAAASVLAFERTHPAGRVLVVANLGSAPAVDVMVATSAGSLRSLYGDGTTAGRTADGLRFAELEPLTVSVYAVAQR